MIKHIKNYLHVTIALVLAAVGSNLHAMPTRPAIFLGCAGIIAHGFENIITRDNSWGPVTTACLSGASMYLGLLGLVHDNPLVALGGTGAATYILAKGDPRLVITSAKLAVRGAIKAAHYVTEKCYAATRWSAHKMGSTYYKLSGKEERDNRQKQEQEYEEVQKILVDKLTIAPANFC